MGVEVKGERQRNRCRIFRGFLSRLGWPDDPHQEASDLPYYLVEKDARSRLCKECPRDITTAIQVHLSIHRYCTLRGWSL